MRYGATMVVPTPLQQFLVRGSSTLTCVPSLVIHVPAASCVNSATRSSAPERRTTADLSRRDSGQAFLGRARDQRYGQAPAQAERPSAGTGIIGAGGLGTEPGAPRRRGVRHGHRAGARDRIGGERLADAAHGAAAPGQRDRRHAQLTSRRRLLSLRRSGVRWRDLHTSCTPCPASMTAEQGPVMKFLHPGSLMRVLRFMRARRRLGLWSQAPPAHWWMQAGSGWRAVRSFDADLALTCARCTPTTTCTAPA